jgi:vacuolar-type H+-ATPase subunit E/Vma4
MRLEAFERGLGEEAQARIDRRLARARADAEALVARARREAEAQVERARVEGTADADRAMAVDLLDAKRRARRLLLEAERAAYQGLRAAAREAVDGLRGDETYRRLLDRLEAAARAQLGPDARIVRDPSEGGVIGEAGGRRVDYSLPALVERAVDSVAADLARTWA